MLFSCKFSNLVKRSKGNTDYFIAHSSSFDKTGIIFFPPKDPKILDYLNELSLPQNKERLKDYVFKVTYRSWKEDGFYKNFFNVIDILVDSVN